MNTKKVTIVPTGVANIASVISGLKRAGADVQVSTDARQIQQAGHVMLPGVGAFHAGMSALQQAELVEVLKTRIQRGEATLAVCLGLQLLCETSAESPGVKGLGLIPAPVERFPNTLRVPQMGWNTVQAAPSCRILQDGWAYFANSYCLRTAPEGWSAAQTTYGSPFVAALERGDVLACQFHPELSGEWGVALLQRWLDGGSSC